MLKLEPPVNHIIRAAIGWVELGDPDSAEQELNHLPEAFQTHPVTLDVRWQISAGRKHWKTAFQQAQAMVDKYPRIESGWIHRSYALHEMGRTEEAKKLLEPALLKFPDNGIIRYNLACYNCRMGKYPEAVRQVIEAGKQLGKKKLLKMAEDDGDLAPIFNKIRHLLD